MFRHLYNRLLERLYDAAKVHHQHRPVQDGRRSGDGIMEHARDNVTVWARHLDENHDLVTGLLTTLALTVCRGTIEPMVRLRGGGLATVINDRLADLWAREKDSLDASASHSWAELSFLAARTWLRDGDLFVNHLFGEGSGTAIPYRAELLEPDFCPFELTTKNPVIVHGVEKSGFNGAPVAYYFWVEHPGNKLNTLLTTETVLRDTVRVPAERISHVKLQKRLHQTRGVSALHAVVHRLDSLHEYEESEAIAARVAASLCAAIIRQPGFGTISVNSTSGERPFEMSAGQVFELAPGEDVRTIGANRPNSEMSAFRRGQLRAVAAGTGTRYSQIARDYSDGSYSSQRQELVEGRLPDDWLRDSWDSQFTRPIWRRFVQAALLAGQVTDIGVNPDTLLDCRIGHQSVPWIDIQKEVAADAAAVMAGFKSRQQVIRERGYSVREIDREREQDTMPATPPVSPVNEDDGDENQSASSTQ